jgi:hypothetical protein
MVNTIMEPTCLATITISAEEEIMLLSLISELKLEHPSYKCNCIARSKPYKGRSVSKFELDVDHACIEIIRKQLDIIRMTVTDYSVSDFLGLRTMDIPEHR